MPYSAIIKSTDNRLQKQAATPTVLRNCQVERANPGAPRRSQFFIGPTPGRTRVVTLMDDCRGLFAADGCQNGKLYAPAGGDLNEVTSSYGFTAVGTGLSGGDVVVMRADRADLRVLAFGGIYGWNGSSFSQVVDGDAPNPAATLAVVGGRVVAAFDDLDAFGWAKAGLFSDWDSNGQAADVDLSDPIVGQENCNGDLCSLNSSSIQFWQATGGIESEAFAPIPGATFRATGLLARDAVAKTRDGLMFLGADRVPYEIVGQSVRPLPYADLELALRDVLASDLERDARVWSYTDGAHEFVGYNVGLDRCFVYDRMLGLWHERTRYGVSAYDVDFAARAFGKVHVAGLRNPYIWRLDPQVYTDDGDPIIRVMTAHIPVGGDVPVDRIVLDAEFYDQPEEGQGSAPTIMLEVSMDLGRSWCEPRHLSLPALGDYISRVQDFQFGLASAERGVLVRLTLTDPIGFNVAGFWINPSREEVP